MKINWKLRFQSPQFWVALLATIVSPILTYMGLTGADLTTWESVWNLILTFVSNPYLIGTVIMSVLIFLGIITDPTTIGWSDSKNALTYTVRNK